MRKKEGCFANISSKTGESLHWHHSRLWIYGYESLLASAENLRQEYDRLLTWADLFDTCSFEAKKMIVAQFVKAVRVSRDYNIEIDFNVSFEEFQNFSVKNGEPVILQPLRSHTA